MSLEPRSWKLRLRGLFSRGVSAFVLVAIFHTCVELAAQQPVTGPPIKSADAPAQGTQALAAQFGTINGTVTDAQDEVIPGAVVSLQAPDAADSRKTTSNDNGFFEFTGVNPGAGYRIAIHADGFSDWVSPPLALAAGQVEIVTGINMVLQGGQMSVTVSASPAELATEQVKIAEQQRVFGVIPNFYVAYDPSAPPLTAKLKFQLAFKVSTDPITMAGIFFMAGVNQGVRIPDYRLGAMGYGQRVGAVAADGFTDIFFGGAVLPSILHQDPRYFYQGAGSNRARLRHALAAPFVCRGDNGHPEPNFSTVGGDMISAGLSTLYYPRADRTVTFFGENVMISTVERTASTVTQEFVLRHFTSGPRGKGSSAKRSQ